MRHKSLHSIMFILLFVVLYIPSSFSQTTNVLLTNDVLTGKVYEIDVYVQSTSGSALELATFGFGLQFPTASLNGGTVTPTYVDGSTQLNALQTTSNTHFTKAVSGSNTVIRISSNSAPGSGNGSMLSTTAPGTKMYRVRLTNTADWIITGTNSILVATSAQYPSNLNCYIATVNTNIWTSHTNVYNLSGPILPVELSSFTSAAQGRTVVLNWSTKTEKNSNRFEVERSLVSNGTWSTVGSVQASVLSNSPKSYSYSDAKLQSGKYQYRLKMIDNDGTFSYSSVEAADVAVPKDFAVSQNYPNPFNPSTTIAYQIPVDAKVIMEVYNIAGQKVTELVNQDMSAGYYTANFGASKISSGVYIYRVVAVDKVSGNNFSSIKKMVLLK
jgi:hypothetical protein